MTLNSSSSGLWSTSNGVQGFVGKCMSLSIYRLYLTSHLKSPHQFPQILMSPCKSAFGNPPSSLGGRCCTSLQASLWTRRPVSPKGGWKGHWAPTRVPSASSYWTSWITDAIGSAHNKDTARELEDGSAAPQLPHYQHILWGQNPGPCPCSSRGDRRLGTAGEWSPGLRMISKLRR